ncbi:hypothetical protein [Microbulbifer variabilis]|uniref:hypothetical protein n=1 Tax=Microbulbifer variabilis TaxID=266805 RepID=UPI001CFF2ACB|nr:hypothetical protein [Microbulbifer variabilis]
MCFKLRPFESDRAINGYTLRTAWSDNDVVQEVDVRKVEYKVAVGESGFFRLEKKVIQLLNENWKSIDGLAFNAGYLYQAMARVVNVVKPSGRSQSKALTSSEGESIRKQSLGAQDTMHILDGLT